MNVVFDLGAVLINWDPRNLYRKVFKDEVDMEWFLTHVCHPEWNLEQDKGRSFDDAVIEATARHPKHAIEIAMYRDRWMEMVPGAIMGSVDILEELLPSIRSTGAYFQMRLTELQHHFPFIREVRGQGLMIGMDLDIPGKQIVLDALADGMLINCTHDTVLRFLPPYILAEREVDVAVAKLTRIFRKTS